MSPVCCQQLWPLVNLGTVLSYRRLFGTGAAVCTMPHILERSVHVSRIEIQRSSAAPTGSGRFSHSWHPVEKNDASLAWQYFSQRTVCSLEPRNIPFP